MSVYHEVINTPPSQSFRLLRWDDSLAKVRACVGPGESVPVPGSGERWHAHRAVELTFIESGAGTRFVGDDIGTIQPPELVLIGADLPHYWSGLGRSAGISAQFDSNPRRGWFALPESQALEPLMTAARRGLLYRSEVATEAGRRLSRMPDLEPLSRLTELLGVLVNLSHALTDARPLCQKPFTITATAPHSTEISRAIDLLIDHFKEELCVDDVCQAVGLSRATLCRRFRRYTGRTVIEFLNGVRIDHACRLLVDSSTSINQVAFQSGFRNLSHFNRQFRRAVGRSPRDHRRGYRDH